MNASMISLEVRFHLPLHPSLEKQADMSTLCTGLDMGEPCENRPRYSWEYRGARMALHAVSDRRSTKRLCTGEEGKGRATRLGADGA